MPGVVCIQAGIHQFFFSLHEVVWLMLIGVADFFTQCVSAAVI